MEASASPSISCLANRAAYFLSTPMTSQAQSPTCLIDHFSAATTILELEFQLLREEVRFVGMSTTAVAAAVRAFLVGRSAEGERERGLLLSFFPFFFSDIDLKTRSVRIKLFQPQIQGERERAGEKEWKRRGQARSG